jgi:DNA-binding NtrC family response regulator
MAKTLLIIEDETLLAKELQRHYQREKWRVMIAGTCAEARRMMSDEGLLPLVVISDMNLPDGNALDLLEELGVGECEWLFLTGYGSVADSVRALRLGAFDFLEKPVDFSRLDLVVAGAARSARAQRRLHDESNLAARRYTPQSFLGASAAALEVQNMLGRLCRAPVSALVISGETGTGKGIAARILHHCGARRDGPLVEINCSALPKELMESELFGHEAGAFTGAKARRRGLLEQADGGTLFLDEIGEMPLDLQAKLLKAIEEQSFRRIGGEHEINVDIQVIAASNQDLAACVMAGGFREDLYHRLSVFQLHLPPLRERIEDLDVLVPRFVAEFNAQAGRNVTIIPEAVWKQLRAHGWSGNVRELRNVIERCVLFADGRELPLQWLQLRPMRDMQAAADNPLPATAAVVSPSGDGRYLQLVLDGTLALDDIDRAVIEAVLKRHHNNVAAAARTLNTTRDTLRYRIRKYGLSPENDA